MFFKGYIETKNKKSIEKFKGRTDFKTYDEIKSLPEFAGVLHRDSILVDIDDYDESEILFEMIKAEGVKCRVYKTTRGKHFLFKNNGVKTNKTGTNTACGIHADIKLGSKNSYEVIKYKGKFREILQECDDGEADLVPKWLFPIKSNINFVNMGVGDGRNQALYNYILTLQSNDFSTDEIKTIIKLINSHLFEAPLSENEIETILRDDAFKKPVFFKGSTFLFDKFAVFLKNQHNIKRINNQLHIYKDGVYISGLNEIEAEMIKHIPSLNRSKRAEVLAYLDLIVRENVEISPAYYIAFRNGIYDLKNDKLIDFNPNVVITNKIDWDYNKNAYDKNVDDVLNNISCNDEHIRMLLEEMTGYTLYRRNELGKAFILTGSGANGKSTYLNMLKHMICETNISVLDLNKLDDRFSTVMLFGKLANIGDDISGEFIPNAAEFRKIVTGESIAAEQKGQPKFNFKPYVKLIFSANNIPRMGKGKDSTAILRRLVIIPFNAEFTKAKLGKNFKPFIGDDLHSQQAMEYLIQVGLKGLKRVLENRNFTTSDKVKRELEEYEEANNPIIGFFKETDKEEVENESTKDVYRLYKLYCLENNISALARNQFSREIKKYYGYEIKVVRINGKLVRIFISK